MSNLGNFAELIKKANEEKKLREEVERARKKTEVAPLLSELFSTIVRAKEVQQEVSTKEAPMLAELQAALSDPAKFLSEKQDKKDKIIELVSELETKAAEIQDKVDNSTDSNTIDTTDLEKKFLKLFNRLQSDFQTLKKYVDQKQSQMAGVSFGGGGSGEVRILRMDDVVKGSVPQNGSVMTWDSSLNKFKFAMPVVSSGGATTDEEMPYSKRVDFVTDNELYKGEAAVGSPESSAVWRIRKVTIGADNDVTELWANGVSDYVKVWVNRLSYTYS